LSTAVNQARGRLAGLRRNHGPDDPLVIAARADLAKAVETAGAARREAKIASAATLREVRLAQLIKQEADADPPLTAEQRSRLAILLTTPAKAS
jgi:hypothetical protein